MVLGHGEKRLGHAAAEDAEVRGAGYHAGRPLRNVLEDAVEGALEQGLERALVARALVGGDAVRLGVGHELPVHGQKRLGLLLQVCVHDAHDLARGVGEPGEKRRLLAVIAREVHPHDARRAPGAGKPVDELPGLVTTSIVDEDELIGEAGGAKGFGDAVKQQREALVLLVAGYDHRKVHALLLLSLRVHNPTDVRGETNAPHLY